MLMRRLSNFQEERHSMSKEAAPYTRLGRILALMDFSWGRTQRMLDRVGELDAWMNRFRPGGPHALWIAGHLAYVEAGSLARYTGAEHALASWKDLFGNGSETVDDAARYPAVAQVSAALRDVRARVPGIRGRTCGCGPGPSGYRRQSLAGSGFAFARRLHDLA